MGGDHGPTVVMAAVARAVRQMAPGALRFILHGDAERLVEFAIMGAAYHRAVHGSARPTIGLLNVGVETEKGHEDVRGADRLLRSDGFDLDYRGFVEGDDIAKGVVDVIVTDGFT